MFINYVTLICPKTDPSPPLLQKSTKEAKCASYECAFECILVASAWNILTSFIKNLWMKPLISSSTLFSRAAWIAEADLKCINLKMNNTGWNYYCKCGKGSLLLQGWQVRNETSVWCSMINFFLIYNTLIFFSNLNYKKWPKNVNKRLALKPGLLW